MNFTNCGITSQDWYTMNEIISDIYTAIPYPNLNAIIRKLESLILFSHSISCLIGNNEGNVEFFMYKSDDIPEEHIQLYCKKYIHYDFILWYCAVPKELTFRESDVIVEKYMAESLFMKEWLSPINAYYGLVINTAGYNYSYCNICLYRSREEGDFSDRDLAILKIINSHLCNRFKELFPNGIQRSSFDKNSDQFSSIYHLTKREAEVIQLICSGTLRHNLAKELYISENTVKKHLNSIYQKMNIQNFEELVKVVKPGVKYFG